MKMDRNGYGPELIPRPEGRCFVCGRTDRPLQRHEVFHGPYRRKSKEYGCWVRVCDWCHGRIHGGKDLLDRKLKVIFQHKAMKEYGWDLDRWREVFGKNYEETPSVEAELPPSAVQTPPSEREAREGGV